ncbi:MAG: PilT/PilU family type 4a pilus ATPase [Verrucomicrobiota bacterium]|jgi:twitching motility protein PilT|nr:twitching motility protein [Opitutae bacterium]MBO26499.1 twitching motility protein [Opitutales bacterium]MEC7395064.1 PilT/PilU family type 4a pilus ATPase [Verrucomicrobiota bacterium]MEC7543082.1 PilT/PilU family type 4a pilus ATPase [Verrucomicrobiota bacterium]MEC7626899.1 PilT/PilU family type 4a pilus ATPase [Verrucomicrobiota bacterium]
MSQHYDLNQAIYQVGQNSMSLAQLLNYFVDPSYQRGNLSRISDMHVKTGRPVSFRIDDDLTPIPEGSGVSDEVIRYMLGVLLSEKHLSTALNEDQPEDVDTAFEWKEKGVNFRINVFRDRDGLAFVMRVLASNIPSIQEVGLPSEKIWQDITSLKRGLVLVTGVTGSGKSTTISALINHINLYRKTRIITLEDPVEFLFQSEASMVSQRQVGQDVPTFAGGLRSALRENPDVIFVGEIRDTETASLALSAAETGHLVFSTLHTRDAKGALSRIVDMFPSEQTKSLCLQLSFSLSFVLSQKLVPRADGNGRILAMEVLKNIPALGNLIRTGNWQQVYSTMETQSKEGMMTMEQHLLHLYEHQVITKESAITYTNEATLIERLG